MLDWGTYFSAFAALSGSKSVSTATADSYAIRLNWSKVVRRSFSRMVQPISSLVKVLGAASGCDGVLAKTHPDSRLVAHCNSLVGPPVLDHLICQRQAGLCLLGSTPESVRSHSKQSSLSKPSILSVIRQYLYSSLMKSTSNSRRA